VTADRTYPSGLLGGSETILLVEDDEGTRRLVALVLERLGYTVLDAPLGVDALSLYKENKEEIDLILIDVVMPGMYGFELVKHLRQERRDIPTLYMSGYMSAESMTDHAMLDPQTSFIQKPFPPKHLAKKVRQVLDAASDANHAGSHRPPE